MKIVTKYPDGVFCWVDLTTTDTEGAKAFYGGLFGWEFNDQPTDMGSVYTMCKINGHSVAGLGPQPPDMAAQGIPPIWSSYVKHDDVDAIANWLLDEHKIALVPGSAFGDPRHLRMSFASSDEVLDEAFDRLAGALDRS